MRKMLLLAGVCLLHCSPLAAMEECCKTLMSCLNGLQQTICKVERVISEPRLISQQNQSCHYSPVPLLQRRGSPSVARTAKPTVAYTPIYEKKISVAIQSTNDDGFVMVGVGE